MKRAVEIKGTKYPMKFGYGVLKGLGKKWKCKGVNSTFKVIGEIFDEEEGIAFDQEERFVDLVIAGAAKHTPDNTLEDLETDEILQAFIFDPKNMEIFMEAFQEIRTPDSGNPKPRREVRKKARAAAKKS